MYQLRANPERVVGKNLHHIASHIVLTAIWARYDAICSAGSSDPSSFIAGTLTLFRLDTDSIRADNGVLKMTGQKWVPPSCILLAEGGYGKIHLVFLYLPFLS